MKLKIAAAITALTCAVSAFALAVLPSASSAQTTSGLSTTCATPTCLTQTTTGTLAGGQAVNLTTTVNRFVNQRGSLLANVTTTGTVGTTTVNQTQNVPVNSLAAADPCTILDLTLGPLHLNVLGLVVDLNQVHLTITGQTGPGNLLGNLLCGLANALNGGQAGGLAHLLNNLLASLGL